MFRKQPLETPLLFKVKEDFAPHHKQFNILMKRDLIHILYFCRSSNNRTNIEEIEYRIGQLQENLQLGKSTEYSAIFPVYPFH